MLDCWKEDPELRPSFSFLKRKTEEIIQQANQAYPYLDFNLNDYLPYCNLLLTSEAVSTEISLRIIGEVKIMRKRVVDQKLKKKQRMKKKRKRRVV